METNTKPAITQKSIDEAAKDNYGDRIPAGKPAGYDNTGHFYEEKGEDGIINRIYVGKKRFV